MFADIVFNGRELRLRSGAHTVASLKEFLAFGDLQDGLYDLKVAASPKPASPPKLSRVYDPYKSTTKESPEAPKSLFPLIPASCFKKTSLWLSPKDDFRYSGLSSGIQIKPYFFDYIDAYAKHYKKEALRLRVEFGNKAPWMATAKKEIGQKEVKGAKANQRILDYFKASKFWGKDDSGGANAWCASFVAWIMEQHGYVPPKNSFRAKEWANFGKSVSEPTFGCIGVKSRSGGGHVAFVMGKSKDGKSLYMLGGNQSDSVKVSKYPRSVWTDFVVPNTYDQSKDWLPIYTKAADKAGRES